MVALCELPMIYEFRKMNFNLLAPGICGSNLKV